jgi:hypothetical protein
VTSRLTFEDAQVEASLSGDGHPSRWRSGERVGVRGSCTEGWTGHLGYLADWVKGRVGRSERGVGLILRVTRLVVSTVKCTACDGSV